MQFRDLLCFPLPGRFLQPAQDLTVFANTFPQLGKAILSMHVAQESLLLVPGSKRPVHISCFSFLHSQEFANFVDDLGMNISFSVTHDLYNALAAPCDGVLILSNFYKNLKGETCTLTELHRRLEEVGECLTGYSGVAPLRIHSVPLLEML